MTWLIVGLVLFLGVHVVPHFAGARQRLIDRVGLWPYKAMFALVSLAGVALMVFGYARSEIIALWEPPPWSSIAALAIMPIAFVLVLAAYAPNNIRRFMRHPMLTGVLLWAVTHLFTNGDEASVIVFSSIACYSVFAMWSANRRGAALSSRVVSFGYDAAVLAVGLLAFAIVLYAHEAWFGVAVIQ